MWKKKRTLAKRDLERMAISASFWMSIQPIEKSMPGQTKNATPDSVQFHAMQQSDQLSNVAQQVLVYHESEVGASSGSDWMSRLKEESMNFLAEQKRVQLNSFTEKRLIKKAWKFWSIRFMDFFNVMPSSSTK